MVDKPEKHMQVTVRAGKIIIGKMKDRKFLDTFNYQKMGVEDLGKIVGTDKLQHPKCFGRAPIDSIERRQLEIYCCRDAIITWKYIDKFANLCNEIGCVLKNTVSSTGLDYWRRTTMSRPIYKHPENNIRFDIENAFKGGRTEVIRRGLIDGDVYLYDYASHYPARCFYGIDGKGSYPDPNSWHHLKKGNEDIIELSEGICEVTMECPDMFLPCLGIRHSGGLKFPSGTFNTTATFIEIRQAINEGYKIKDIGRMIYYTSNMVPFRNVVDKLYKLRQRYKIEENSFQALVKTLMNGGLFGKFGYNPFNKEEIFEDSDVYIEDGILYHVDENGKKIYFESFLERDGVFYAKDRRDMYIPDYCIPIFSTYTTALGRIKLYDDAKRSGDSLIYMDTDSIHTQKKCYSTGNELGDLEYEGKSDESLYIRPKLYMSNGKVKSKGVGRMAKARFYEFTNNPSVETRRFVGFKESRSRQIPNGAILTVPKYLDLEDTKRTWKKRFVPFRQEFSRSLYIEDGMTTQEREKVMRKVLAAERLQARREMEEFVRSDMFDSAAVGSDTSYEDFIENEKYFEMM